VEFRFVYFSWRVSYLEQIIAAKLFQQAPITTLFKVLV